MVCTSLQYSDQMHCQCGQVWDAGDDRPACLDWLYYQLDSADIGVNFTTDASPEEVRTVWAERVDLHGMHPKIWAVEQGYTVISIELDAQYELNSRDWVWFGVAAYLALVCMGAYIGANLT